MLWAPVTYGLKHHYSVASVADLWWVLGPTSRVLELLSGVPFPLEPGVGYVSRELATAIVPGCAGVNFMIAAWSVLLCAHGLRQRRPITAPVLLPVAYAATVVVNALRIWLDIALRSEGLMGLSHASQHRALGVVIYLLALAVLYRFSMLGVVGGNVGGDVPRSLHRLAPLICYLGVALMIPLLNGASGSSFREHTFEILVICGVVLACAEAGRALLREASRATHTR